MSINNQQHRISFADKVFKSSKSVVPKVCSEDPKGSATSSKGIRGYISVMATLKFTYFF
jgi:hypothetical protein